MSREALVLLVCCCDFRDGAERLIPSKSLGNAVIRAFPGLFRILRMCAPRHAAAVVRPRERKKSADRRRRILISRLLIIRASVPRRKSPFPAYFKGFPAVSPLIPPYPAFLKYPVSPQWETPCGLLVDGKSDLGRGLACCDASFQGIDYCPENDNPLLRCPYERKDCPHSISGFPVPLCPCHTTGKRYSFEQSAEKVETERSERQHRQYMEITGGVYCACVVGCNGYEGGRVEVKYDVEQCIRCRCQNPVCVIRKQERDLSRANIFYDVRRTWITRIGFLEEKKVQVTKGERVFPHPVARTDAEIWLEMKKAHFNPLWSSSVIDSPHLTPEDRRQTFFSKMHRRYGEYDYFEFHYDVENIRIAKSEQRDLLQDLRDVADGLEVVHAVDLKKEQAAKKRESRQRRREQKERRLNKPRSPAPLKEEQLTLLTEEEHFSNGDQTG